MVKALKKITFFNFLFIWVGGGYGINLSCFTKKGGEGEFGGLFPALMFDFVEFRG